MKTDRPCFKLLKNQQIGCHCLIACLVLATLVGQSQCFDDFGEDYSQDYPTTSSTCGSSDVNSSIRFPPTPYNGVVKENVSLGTSVITVSATTPSACPVQYKLVNSSDAKSFAINTITGMLLVASSLDYESQRSYVLTAEASLRLPSGNFSDPSNTTNVFITVVNVNDHLPTFVGQPYKANATDTTPIGTLLVTVLATDHDVYYNTLSYLIYGGNALELFSINNVTGAIYMASSPLNVPSQTFSLMVRVSDGLHDGSTTVEIKFSAYCSSLRSQTSGLGGACDDVKSLQNLVVPVVGLGDLRKATGVWPFIINGTVAVNELRWTDLGIQLPHFNIMSVELSSTHQNISILGSNVTFHDDNIKAIRFNDPVAVNVSILNVVVVVESNGTVFLLKPSLIRQTTANLMTLIVTAPLTACGAENCSMLYTGLQNTYRDAMKRGSNCKSPFSSISYIQNISLDALDKCEDVVRKLYVDVQNITNQNSIQSIVLSGISEQKRVGYTLDSYAIRNPAQLPISVEFNDLTVPFVMKLNGSFAHFLVRQSLDFESMTSYLFNAVFTATKIDGSKRHVVIPVNVTIANYNDNPPYFSQSIYHSNISDLAAIGTSVLQVQVMDKDLLALRQPYVDRQVHLFTVISSVVVVSSSLRGMGTQTISFLVYASDFELTANATVEIYIRDDSTCLLTETTFHFYVQHCTKSIKSGNLPLPFMGRGPSEWPFVVDGSSKYTRIAWFTNNTFPLDSVSSVVSLNLSTIDGIAFKSGMVVGQVTDIASYQSISVPLDLRFEKQSTNFVSIVVTKKNMTDTTVVIPQRTGNKTANAIFLYGVGAVADSLCANAYVMYRKENDNIKGRGISCTVTNPDSDIAARAVNSLEVQYAPRFVIRPSNYILDTAKTDFDLGKSVGCDARSNYTGFVGMTVVWYRKDGGYWNRVNSTFTLFTAFDNGEYMCQVRTYFGSVNSTSVHVEVYDTPRFIKNHYVAVVYENASVGSSVLTVVAYSANYLSVNYKFESGVLQPSHPFQLDRKSGVLSVSTAIDSGQFTSDQFLKEYQLTVIATLDGYNTSRNCQGRNLGIGCTIIIIKVVDINEVSPMFSSRLYSANVSSLAIPTNLLFNKIAFENASLQLAATDGDKTSTVTYSLINYTTYFSINSSSGVITVISYLTSFVGQTLNLIVKAADQDGKEGNTTVSVYVYEQCVAVKEHVALILNSLVCRLHSVFSSGMKFNSGSMVNATQWVFYTSSRRYYDALKISLSMTNINLLNRDNNTGWIDVYFQQSEGQVTQQVYVGRHLIQQAELKGDFVYWIIISPLLVTSSASTIILNVTIFADGLTTVVQPRASVNFDDSKTDSMYLIGNGVPTGCEVSRLCKEYLTSFKQQERLAAAFGQQCVYGPPFKTHLVNEVYQLARDCVKVDNITIKQDCPFSTEPFVSASNVSPLPETLVNLTCNVRDMVMNSDETTITWLFEGKILRIGKNDGFVKYLPGSKLQLPTISAERRGRYSCCVSCESSGKRVMDTKCSSPLLVAVQGMKTFFISLTINQVYNSQLDNINSLYAISLKNNLFNLIRKRISLGRYDLVRLNAFRNGSVVAEVFLDLFNTTLSKDDIQSQIELERAASDVLDIMKVVVNRFDACSAETSTDFKGTFNWRETSIGQSATVLCPHGSFENVSNVAFATRNCEGSHINGSYWGIANTTKCEYASVATQQLRMLSMISKDAENGKAVIKATQLLTSNTTLTDEDLTYVADIVENVVANKMEVDLVVLNSVVQTVSNTLVPPAEVVKSSQLKTNASSRILQSIEDAAFKVDLVNGTTSLTVTSPNIAVAVYKTNTDKEFQGHTFASLLLHDDDIIAPDVELQSSQIVSIPMSDTLNTDNSIEASIGIPKLAFSSSLTSRLQFFLFQNGKFFQSASVSQLEGQQLDSRIIAAKLESYDTFPLSEPSVLKFRHYNKTYLNATCVFWDFAAGGGYGDWSSDGCKLISDIDGLSTCECDHLTNFAVLVDPYQGRGIPGEHQEALSVISYIGCSLSLVGLLLTAAAYGFSKRFRKERPGTILINLCISMASGLLFFIAYAENHGNAAMCTASAVLLHYFWLTTICWMMVEGVNMYLCLVKVLGTYIHRFMLKASVFAWGVPLVVVVVTMGADFGAYEKDESDTICLLSTPAFYYSFYSVIGVLLVGNFAVFGLVLQQLNKRTAGVLAARNQGNIGKQLRAAVSITLLLGLSWIFAAMGTETGTGNTVRLAFQYLFALTVSTQGFLIFLVYCVLRKDVRNEWLKMICKYQSKSADDSQTAMKMTESRSAGSGLTVATTKTDLPMSYVAPAPEELRYSSIVVESENQLDGDGINKCQKLSVL